MADLKLVGAVAIKVRPDAKGFRKDAESQINTELKDLKPKVELSAKVKADTSGLKKDVAEASDEIEKASLTLKVGLDHDSIVRAQKQLDEAIKHLADEVIVINFDDEGSIEEAQRRLDEMKVGAKVEMEFAPDEKGFRDVLAKIEAIRREKITQIIEFDTDDESLDALEEATRAALHRDSVIEVRYENNRDSLQKALNMIKAEQEKLKAFKFDFVVNKENLKTARKIVENTLADTPVKLKVDYDDQDSIKRTRDALQRMLNEVRGETLKVKFNEQQIQEEIDKLNSKIQEEVKDEQVEIDVHASRLELVARQLQFASRARRVPFFVVVDQKSVAVAEGILRSLAGVNTLESFGRGLESVITKFDTFSLKAGAWSAGIAGLVDSLVFMTTALFTIGDGMFEVVGLAALAPAAFASLATVVFVAASVFKDFGAAVHGIDAALKRLPPSGQKAALLIRKVFADMRESISVEFWGKASDAMLAFAERTLPVFTDGLARTAGEMGRVFAGILDSFTKSADSGQLKTMFDNLVLMLDNAVRGTTALWDAFNILGIRGSEFLPKFGTWLSDISERFRDWLILMDQNGNITAWINDGITSLKDMFFATGAIIDQFKAIARAAGLVGPNGLDDFRRNMEHLARVMLAEPWQSQMASIFTGARQGASLLNDGFQDLWGALKESAFWTGQVLTLLGQLGGGFLSGLGTLLGRPIFQQGQLEVLRAMNEMLIEMKPAFRDLGDVIGNLSKIASGVFKNLAPVFNTVVRILDTAVSRLQTNLQGIAPGLLTLTNNLLSFAQFPLMVLVDGLNLLAGALNAMPGPLRDAALAFGTFLLLRNQFGAFATMLSGFWTNLTTSAVRGRTAIAAATAQLGQDLTNNVTSRYRMMADGSIRQLNLLGTATTNGMSAIRRQLSTPIPVTAVSAGLAAELPRTIGLVGRINGALSLIGGIPGLVIGALGVALATIGGNAATAAANVDRLHGSLNKLTGETSTETLQIIAENISNINEAGDAWANFWRGVVRNSAAGNETLEKLGINVGDAAKAIAGTRQEFDNFLGTLDAISKAQRTPGFADFMKDGSLPSGPKNLFDTGEVIGGNRVIPKLTEEDIKTLRDGKKAMEELGVSVENLPSPQSLDTLTESVKSQRAAVEIAQKKQQIYADTLGVTSLKAAEVAAITQQLGDKSIDASGKIDAIRKSLDLMNNRDNKQFQDIVKMDQLEAGLENAKAIAESVKAAGAALLGGDGLLNAQSKAARDLFAVLREQADNVLIAGQAAYDAAVKNGDTAAVASEKALAIVKNGRGDLQKFADALGVDIGVIQKQFDSFFGEDWTLVATFTGRPDLFLAAAKQAKEAGVEFDGKEFTAWLLANGDPATLTVDDVKAYINQFAEGEYKAKLEADKLPALEEIALALGKADEYAKGDYRAIMLALNNAAPGVNEALMEINRLIAPDDPFRAILYALMESGALSFVQAQLALLARPILIRVGVDTTDLYRDAAAAGRGAAAAAQRAASAASAARIPTGFRQPIPQALGGILGASGVKHFANGGIENHIAQITKPNGPIRIWSERETHGEAYVPMAASKRPRSVKILGEVARRFGYTLNKAQQFADGGTTTAGASSRPTPYASVSVGTINTVDPETAIRKLRTMQLDAFAVAGIL